jgi:ParB-like chromosome segregation protein Spo0J
MTEEFHNPADKVERWEISRLVPYARNSRTHSDEQIGQIAASIKEWGWTTPVLVDEGGSIIAGHGRTLAAQRLKMTEVPVMVAKGWSDAKKRAYVIADNKLALNAGWDESMLNIKLGELQDLGFDISLIGFGKNELAELMAEEPTEGLTDENAVPEVQEKPKSQRGDVWLLGQHRLMCGGSTMIACEKTHRKSRLMELDPKFCDVIVKRWQEFTGKIATHAETGQPFAEVTNGKN